MLKDSLHAEVLLFLKISIRLWMEIFTELFTYINILKSYIKLIVIGHAIYFNMQIILS